MIRAHSASATAPSALVGSPSRTTRRDALGVTARSACVTSPTTRPAWLRPGGRSTGTRAPAVVQVVLDEGAAGPGEQPDELVRVDRAAAAGAQHLLRVVVERLEPLGRRRRSTVGDHTRARLVGEPRRDLVRAAVGRRDPALDEHLLDPGARRQRRDGALQRGELLDRRVDRRPDVQQDVVHVEPRRRPAPRAVRARRIASRQLGDRPLGVRQRRDPARRRRGRRRARGPGPARRAAGRPRCRVRRSGRAARPRARRSRVISKSRSRHRFSRRPTIGCTPRTRSSSTTPLGAGAER